ncbi:MAG: SDR family oxidoreductase [Treponema sp.]|nr:SDR family oxidoreductase [Treponema sp.]
MKNAVVIGGTSGIGFELAKILCKNECSVCVSGRHDPCEQGLEFIPADFTGGHLDLDEFPPLREKLCKADILCVSYGPFVQKPLHLTTAQDWQTLALYDYALAGMAVSSVLPGMMERKFGRIVLFGGTRTESVRSYKTNAAYAGAKTAISVLVKSVSAEYRKYGVTCNAVLPGFVNGAKDKSDAVSALSVAQSAFSLIQNENLNGVLLNVDGGWQP